MARYSIEISEPAENDLFDIIGYISTQLSAPESAINIMEAIEEAVENLADMPYKCPIVADERLGTMGYHRLIVKNYIVFFMIDENERIVDIVRILYARRDWLSIL
jgi:plasmid stabilization system protein ParE